MSDLDHRLARLGRPDSWLLRPLSDQIDGEDTGACEQREEPDEHQRKPDGKDWRDWASG